MKTDLKILISIAPTISLVLFYMMISNYTLIQGWHVIVANIILLAQTVWLFKKMSKMGIPRDKKLLYTFLLVCILPFHYVLVWGILKDTKP